MEKPQEMTDVSGDSTQGSTNDRDLLPKERLRRFFLGIPIISLLVGGALFIAEVTVIVLVLASPETVGISEDAALSRVQRGVLGGVSIVMLIEAVLFGTIDIGNPFFHPSPPLSFLPSHSQLHSPHSQFPLSLPSPLFIPHSSLSSPTPFFPSTSPLSLPPPLPIFSPLPPSHTPPLLPSPPSLPAGTNRQRARLIKSQRKLLMKQLSKLRSDDNVDSPASAFSLQQAS